MDVRDKVVSYWRTCLSDMLRRDLDVNKTEQVTLPRKEYKNGRITEETYEKVGRTTKSKKQRSIDCVIAPFVLKPSQRYYNENYFIFPILIPVTLDKATLKFTYDEKFQPWIPRILLEPHNITSMDTLGTMWDYERYLTNNGLLRPDNWDHLLHYVEELDENVLDYSDVEYVIDRECKLFLDVQNNQYATQSLLDFYEQMERDQPHIPLFDEYISLQQKQLTSNQASSFELSKQHLGQMSDEHSLSPSQRETLHNFMIQKSGDILAVNGPPGTGKTTLLQSVVATKFVDSVLQNDETPPIIFVSSTNNQAVTNVIDSFGSTNEMMDIDEKVGLEGRWIPNVKSYGLYVPSKTKFKKLQKDGTSYYMQSPDGDGFLKKANQSIMNQEHTYLEYFEKYSGLENQSLEDAAEWLQSQVKETIQNMWNVIDVLEEIDHLDVIVIKRQNYLQQAHPSLLSRVVKFLTNIDIYFKNLKRKSLIKKLNALYGYQHTNKEYKSMFTDLDRYHRYMAFKYSVHYWEAKYLINQKRKSEEYEDTLKKWKDSAHLFPCHVSTLYTLPSAFNQSKIKGIEPNYNAIDLLIIDEAGQVSPEVGGPAFALSKSALVVGDELQIEPIWNLLPPIDEANMVRSGIARKLHSNSDYHLLKKLGISTTGTSLIKTAQKASSFQKIEGMRGMFLSEHRRCQDDIIRYCNDLAYNGKLEPMATKKKDYKFLPYLGYANIEGEAQLRGGSRYNQNEAKAIAQWVKNNEEQLTQVSGKTISETIAIITPFTQQKLAIKKALGNNYRNVVVGTVHSLQGAERDVIIFSSVYSSNNSFFFDKGVNMLNVAVSRAKQSFLVFGNMKIFHKEGNKPSNLLARYMFSDINNKLRGVQRHP
ncbi:hypothetical protein AAV35_011530 [Salimicrobium jeotgali]|uniref:DNA helicase n=1 Tax=Salimicrobium jeotgali TaxID=1230341 RepID=K2GAH7_9BACI|nr:ATP-binding protein [Salimicrobium jeotgali]AKG05346.1 hypothetical protein AAV35_011530 [Salimicrobium jeotgali]EKE31352.1 hypothetical protein MJ3_08951 [Salimicrobium jeotgali]MBM7696961.1 hypothetical protein [Salimicrobium jeotgali]